MIEAIERDESLEDLQTEVYATVGVGEREARRLLAMAQHGAAGANRFRMFMFGGVLNDTPAVIHAELIRAVADLSGGLEVATELMAMRLHGLRSNDTEIDEHATAVAGELLLKIDFSDGTRWDGHRMETLAAVALAGDEGASVATAVCKTLAAALAKNFWSLGWHWERLAARLFRAYPTTALDAFWRHDSLIELLSDRNSPLREVPDQVLLDWAAADSPRRDLWIAGAIDAVKTAADGRAELSPVAQELLARATDKGAVLDELGRRVLPAAWWGSYRVVSAPRAEMLTRLAASHDPQLAEWARVHLQRISGRAAHEDASERQREESFE